MSSEIRVQRICEHCAKSFEAKTTVTRFCSDYCAKRAYKLRQRQKKILESEKHTKQIILQPITEIQEKVFLSVDDVCSLFGVSRTTVWRMCKTNRVKWAKIGRKCFILRTSIELMFEQQDKKGL